MAVDIRRINKKDLGRLGELTKQLNEYLYGVTRKKVNRVFLQKINELLKKKLKGERIVYVSEEKNKVCGFLIAHILDLGLYNWAMIDDLYISKEARGKNFGKLLVKKFIEKCKKTKTKIIFVITPKKNKGPLKFYIKMGFKLMDSAHLFLKIK